MKKIIEFILNNFGQLIIILIIQILLLTTIAWGVATFIPHNLDVIKNLGWLTWLTIIILYKLITYKYAEESTQESKEVKPVEDEIDLDMLMPIVQKQYPNGSTVIQEEENYLQSSPNVGKLYPVETNDDIIGGSTRE